MLRRVVLLWIALIAASCTSLHAAELLASPHPIGDIPGARASYDASDTLRPQDVWAKSLAFGPATIVPTFSESNEPRIYWFRLTLQRGDANSPIALRYTYKTTHIDVYGADGAHVAGGFDLGAEDQAISPGVLVLPEWALRGKPILVRIATVVSPNDVRVMPLERAYLSPLQRRGVFGFFIGFFAAIGAFNLLLFAILRDRSLINYAAVMLLNTIREAISFGFFWSLLPPLTFLQRELIYDTFALGSQAALAAFTVLFLRLEQRDRFSRNAVLFGLACNLTVYLTDFFPNWTLAFVWTLVATQVFHLTLLIAGIRALRRGNRSARMFIAGVGCIVVGYLLNMSSYWLPRQDLWVYALDVGIALQSVLLAIAVAESVQESRNEHQRLVVESQTLAHLATRDGLTGVLNRRAFDAALAQAVANGTGERLGLLILDIDHFKVYNDALGHLEGDAALCAVARACSACVRDGDIFARYGGEEFAAIVPGADDALLQQIGDRMRESVAALDIAHPHGGPLSISVGGCSVPVDAPLDTHAVVRRADDALYAAKNGGRDRFILSAVAL